MDQAKRARSHSIRTIGRLADRPHQDLVLAQWPADDDSLWSAQDVAVDISWRGASSCSQRQARHATGVDTLTSLRRSINQFEQHQEKTIGRLRDGIDHAEEMGTIPASPFEAPPEALEILLKRIENLVVQGRLSRKQGAEYVHRCREAGECAARLFAISDLYRRGYLNRHELVAKQQSILKLLEAPESVRDSHFSTLEERATMAD